MAAAGRSTASAPAPEEVAAQLRRAPFVRLVGIATGEGLAATGQLARALAAVDVPFQAGLGPLGSEGPVAVDDADDRTVTVERPEHSGDIAIDGAAPPSAVAYDVATALAPEDAAPHLALAGLVAADDASPADRPDIVEEARIEQRPGLGLPVADPVEGLTATTLVHLDASGDANAIADLLGDVHDVDVDAGTDDDTRRRLASTVALGIAADGGPAHAGEVVEAVLRPHVGGPFETVPGYADVCRALAADAPGLGLQVAMGGDTVGDDLAARALATWRDVGQRTHEAVGEADLARFDGLVVARTDDTRPTWPVARLLRDYVAAEPVVVLLGADAALATTRGDAGAFADAVASAAGQIEGRVVSSGPRARASLAATGNSPADFADALQEAI